MAVNETEILAAKLNAESDARLREQIVERVKPLVALSRNLDSIELSLPEGTATGVKTTVVASARELINALSTAAFDARRDQARGAYIDKFLQRVGGMD